MAGIPLKEQNFVTEIIPKHYSVKESVFPFNKFLGVDPFLGPEMRSTGEVMGKDNNFERAFFKAQLGAGVELPKTGKVFVSVRNNDKSQKLIKTAQILKSLNFEIVATKGTAKYLEENQIKSTLVNKVYEGRPNIVDMMKNGEIDLVMNTTDGSQAVEDSRSMRAECLSDGI